MQHYVPMRCKARLRLAMTDQHERKESIIERIVGKLFGGCKH